jgi:serine/threonine protein kinase
MSIIGKSLAHYSITAEIGKGGMGEVYQAKDQKLGRDVAIKVLPEEFAKDAERVARFQREAKLLASLNHPNIAAIYSLEEADGTHFLVMELIEGDTLAGRIKGGPIPVEEALKLALQIAEALEAAHEKGVIHRDLKPANIKVTPEGKVKVLDFGLAKAFAGEQAGLNLSNSPTLSDMATQQGLILGTAAYMSPEQAKGKTVDKKTDIWAFGCVLYEMLTAKAAFQGDEASEILASVIKGDTNLDLLPSNIHQRIREVISRCLQKELRKRYPDIANARYEIEQVLADPSGVFAQPVAIVEPKAKHRQILLWASITVLAAILAGIAVWQLTPTPKPQVVRSVYELPEDQHFNVAQGDIPLAVSPDGSQFAYSTTKGIYIRSLNELDARLISGTDEDAQSLFFSPDGQSIGYFSSADGKLKSISTSGGTPTKLCDANWVSDATWYDDNTIVYTDLYSGIYRIPAKGGTPEVLVERGGVDKVQLLPDGKSVMFVDLSRHPPEVMVQSLETGDQTVIFEGRGDSYLPTGHLVYWEEGSWFARPFDLDKLEFTGGAVPVEATSSYAYSNSGTLAYVPRTQNAAGSIAPQKRSLVWVDRDGREEPLDADPNDYRYLKISPDETKIALTVAVEDNEDIYIWDIVRKNMIPFTFDKANDSYPLWTPDSKSILFRSDRNDSLNTYIKAADGTGKVELFSDQGGIPSAWSEDGKTLVLIKGTEGGIETLPIENGQQIKPLLENGTVPTLSPNGKWLAYMSVNITYKSGLKIGSEIYVCPFPNVNGGKWKVPDEGLFQKWSPDGRELIYWTEDALMVAEVETEPEFTIKTPKVLLQRRPLYSGSMESMGISWDIHPEDGRFLMMKPVPVTDEEPSEEVTAAEEPRKIVIVTNWFEELKEKVPID